MNLFQLSLISVFAVNGVWSEWTPWGKCKSPYGDSRDIHCRPTGGKQSRQRTCLHQAHNGSICTGEKLSETQVCYDVDNCRQICQSKTNCVPREQHSF